MIPFPADPVAVRRRRRRHQQEDTTNEDAMTASPSILMRYFRMSLTLALVAVVTSNHPMDNSKLMPISKTVGAGLDYLQHATLPFLAGHIPSTSSRKDKETPRANGNLIHWMELIGFRASHKRGGSITPKDHAHFVKRTTNKNTLEMSKKSKGATEQVLDFLEHFGRGFVDGAIQLIDPLFIDPCLIVLRFKENNSKDAVSHEALHTAGKCLYVEYRKTASGNTSEIFPTFLTTNYTLWSDKCTSLSASNKIDQRAPHKSTVHKLFDKVFMSTPRLLTIINLMLCVTCLAHSWVAHFFVGKYQPQNSNNRSGVRSRGSSTIDFQCTSEYAIRLVGGYVLFKLVLVSSVLSPLHTLDVLILISWYTALCFQRSLAYMAHKNLGRAMTTMAMMQQHQDHSGGGIDVESNAQRRAEQEQKGILKLLLLAIGCAMISGCGCIILFSKAAGGWPMVVLLLMDSVILCLDILRYLATYAQGIIFEKAYRDCVHALEERQMHESFVEDDSLSSEPESLPDFISTSDDIYSGANQEGSSSNELDQLEQEIENVEKHHHLCTVRFENTTLALEIISCLASACHFGHIWHLHGLRFGLVDSVILLHLHSALSTIRTKIVDRRKASQLLRKIDVLFKDASEEEMQKAHDCGDLCCICLGTMMGNDVKKLRCKHLYHWHCLHKVVERARSLDAAKCPLCRSSVVEPEKGSKVETRESRPLTPRGDPIRHETAEEETTRQAVQQPQTDDTAIFRFSTEGLIPAWLPIPSFSFEVVRRQHPVEIDDQHAVTGAGVNEIGAQPDFAAAGENATDSGSTLLRRLFGFAFGPPMTPEEEDAANVNEIGAQPDFAAAGENATDSGSTLLRRLFGFAFGPPMTPEEEDAALEQLMEMFPQYERDDLLRELRAQGSIEHVAESILLGFFSGAPRNQL